MANDLLEQAPIEKLAIQGGTPLITATPPPNWLHGPNEIGEEEIRAVTEVLKGKVLFRYAKDPGTSTVSQFEEQFAQKTGAKYALAVNSGTSALIAGMAGIGVSQGDEVLLPAYTYIATAAAILALGAFPVLVEIDGSLTMDPDDLEKKITARTKAIIPVHMRGTPCNMARIVEIAQRHGLGIIEDCAQANGGEFRGKALGTHGQAGAFSLQHYKIITAGEGGVVITNSQEVFERAAVYHDSAYAFWMERMAGGEEAVQDWKNTCFLGENYRQSELHAALAVEQLKKRDRILQRTRAIKRKLWAACEAIPGAQMEAVTDREGDCGISLVFFMETPARANSISEALRAEGVQCGTMFSKQIPDRHIFYHWDYVMNKRTPHRNGFPWISAERPCKIDYTIDMCPKSIDWLERSVMMPITQILSDEYVDQVVRAIEKVARHW
jgi:8-amino-3,8-dideoxy-alpha-D-manno-octulosonate transaminase